MKIIDRYIIKKYLGTFFYAIAILAIIIIIFDLSEKVDDFIEKKPTVKEIIFQYYFNFIPYFINLFSSLFAFISVIFFSSKMASNTEIVAMLNGGVSFKRMLRPYLYAATLLALMSFVLSNFIIPQTGKSMQEFTKKYLKSNKFKSRGNCHAQIEKSIFIYVESVETENNTTYGMSVEQFSDSGLVYKLTAQKAVWDSANNIWELHDWQKTSLNKIGENVLYGSKKDTILNIKPKDFITDTDDAAYMNYRELRNFINAEKMRGSNSVLPFEIEKHKRIAFPFATIILTIIGVSLSSRKTRGGIGFHLGAGVTICFAFILFMQVTTVFSIYGNLPPFIAVWIPNILFGILSIYLVKIAPK